MSEQDERARGADPLKPVEALMRIEWRVCFGPENGPLTGHKVGDYVNCLDRLEGASDEEIINMARMIADSAARAMIALRNQTFGQKDPGRTGHAHWKRVGNYKYGCSACGYTQRNRTREECPYCGSVMNEADGVE